MRKILITGIALCLSQAATAQTLPAQHPAAPPLPVLSASPSDTRNVQELLKQYTRQELAVYRARGMIGPSGLPTIPPGGSTKINSQGLPYNATPMSPQEKARDAE